MPAATDNEMCATCRKIMLTKYARCTEACRGLLAYLSAVADNKISEKAERSVRSIQEKNRHRNLQG